MVDTKLDFLVEKSREVHRFRGPHPERERHADVHSQENSTRVYGNNGWTMQPPLRCAANVTPADALNQPSKQATAREKPMQSLSLSVCFFAIHSYSDLCQVFDTEEGQRVAYCILPFRASTGQLR